MKFRKSEEECEGGDVLIIRYITFENEEKVICEFCQENITKDPVLFFCKKGNLFSCKRCELATKLVTMRNGKEVKTSVNNCKAVKKYNIIMDQHPAQVIGYGYDLEHIHIPLNNESLSASLQDWGDPSS